MTSLLVGERFNQRTWRPSLFAIPSANYVNVMTRLGAFPAGHSRVKLESLGVRWTQSMNLLPPDPQGVKWNAELAATVAAYLMLHTAHDLLWLAGIRVARAFGIRADEQLYFQPLSSESGAWEPSYDPPRLCVIVPHPSGLNRWWNHEENVEWGRREIADLTEQLR